MRAELKLPWKEIARVVGVNINTVIGWSKRYSMEGESGLKVRTRGASVPVCSHVEPGAGMATSFHHRG